MSLFVIPDRQLDSSRLISRAELDHLSSIDVTLSHLFYDQTDKPLLHFPTKTKNTPPFLPLQGTSLAYFVASK